MGPRGGHFVTRSLPAAAAAAAPGPGDPPSTHFREARKGKAGSHRGSGAKAEPYADAVPISAASKSRFQNDRWAQLGSSGGDVPVDLSPARGGSLITALFPSSPSQPPLAMTSSLVPKQLVKKLTETQQLTGGSRRGWWATGQDHTQATAIPSKVILWGGAPGPVWALITTRKPRPRAAPQTEAPYGRGLGYVPGPCEQKP